MDESVLNVGHSSCKYSLQQPVAASALPAINVVVWSLSSSGVVVLVLQDDQLKLAWPYELVEVVSNVVESDCWSIVLFKYVGELGLGELVCLDPSEFTEIFSSSRMYNANMFVTSSLRFPVAEDIHSRFQIICISSRSGTVPSCTKKIRQVLLP